MGIETPIIIILICMYIAFPRQTMNILIAIFKRKDYVVISMKKHNSGFIETWNKVPDPNHIISIRKGAYYVPAEYAKTQKGKRLFFEIDENDAIPEYAGRQDEDIIFHAQELRSSLVNKVADRLFNDKKDTLFYIVVACMAITAILVVYSLSKVSQMELILNQMQALTNVSSPGIVMVK